MPFIPKRHDYGDYRALRYCGEDSNTLKGDPYEQARSVQHGQANLKLEADEDVPGVLTQHTKKTHQVLLMQTQLSGGDELWATTARAAQSRKSSSRGTGASPLLPKQGMGLSPGQLHH